MGRPIDFAGIVVALLALPCVADDLAPPAVQDEPELWAIPTRQDRIGRIVAPVMINGRGPFHLIVDTGANSTTFSESLAERLGIDADAKVMMNGVTGRALVPVASVDRVESGALVFTNQQVPIVSTDVLADADGILGVAALSDRQLIVDFRRNRVSLVVSQKLPRHLLRIKVRRLPSGLLTTRAEVSGVRTVVIIDTGAERTLGNAALLQALDESYRSTSSVSVVGTTSDVSDGNVVTVGNIQIGDVRVRNGQITFGDFHVFEHCKLDDRPALLLGMDVIGRLDLFVIDFRRLVVGFRS
mgnify:CR=1 FL=1